MPKLTLQLESLVVQSFHTTPPGLAAGTIAAHQLTADCEPFSGQPDTCGGTCARSCPETCANTCPDTCHESCHGSCVGPSCGKPCIPPPRDQTAGTCLLRCA